MKKIIFIGVLIAAAAWWYYENNKILPLKVSATDVAPPRLLFSVIKDKKLDEKHGLNLELLWSPPGEVERRLATKYENVEIGFYNMLALMATNSAEKTNLRIIAPAINNPQILIVKKESPFNSISDLKGARLGVRPARTAAYNAENIVMRIAGFDKENDFRLTFGTPQEGAALLERGEIDATVLTSSDAAVLLATGQYRAITELEDSWRKLSGAPFPFVDFAAHKEWIDGNGKKIERFRAMLKEAVAYIKSNPTVVDEYKEVLNIRATTDQQMESARRALTGVFSESWDFKSHRFLLEKAAELGYAGELPPDGLFAE